MPTPTMRSRVGDAGGDTPTHLPDIGSEDGLRQAARELARAGWWDTPPGQGLLAEIRRRAVRNAAHIASTAETPLGRDLVDDVVMAAWLVLHQHHDKIATASRPWAYLMSSAQRQVLEEVRAQQLLTNAASIRGRAREVLPRTVNPVGSTNTDLATALRHEPHGNSTDSALDPRIVSQVRRHDDAPLLESAPSDAPPHVRQQWFTTFIDVLVNRGANRTTTIAAVDRIAALFEATSAGRWEWAARRDPILARLGLAPDQASALVALVAGSRHHRHNGKTDSLLRVVRNATSPRGAALQLSSAQVHRLRVYAGHR